MIKYEFLLLINKRINKLILAILLVFALVFSIFAIWSVHYVDDVGVTHAGFTAPRKLVETKNEWKGELTPNAISNVVQDYQKNNDIYGSEIPEKVYATSEQSYEDISNMIIGVLCYDKDFDESAIDKIGKDRSKELYKIRANNIIKEVEEYGTTSEKKQFLQKQYSKVDTPFQYESPESWETMSLYATTYALILLIAISFFAAGIFSDEFRLQSDAVFFTTKLGRSKGTRAKIITGLIMATVVYWLFMLVLSIVSFAVMGISGAKTSIQIEYSYSMYALTFLQKYLVIVLAGYIGSVFAAAIAMLVSAKSHSAMLAICFPFIIFVVSPFIGRALPFKAFFYVTPDQLINVYNCIRLTLIYQFGNNVVMQIPMIMIIYSILTVLIIPFIYFVYKRYRPR